jgi:hypothetical protein
VALLSSSLVFRYFQIRNTVPILKARMLGITQILTFIVEIQLHGRVWRKATKRIPNQLQNQPIIDNYHDFCLYVQVKVDEIWTSITL